jgi:DDE superfamily endonuclease
MLPPATVPASLWPVIAACRPAFTVPGFVTFALLVTGALAAVGPRTVIGMWTAAGMAQRAHWSRAHRFFTTTRWNVDTVGLLLLRQVVDRFAGDQSTVTVAVDDTLFPRYGTNVFGCFWQHDGSARGRDGIGRGTCFVIAGLVVRVPLTARPVLLPVLFRLHRPKTGPSKPQQARELVNLLAGALPEHRLHVVADSGYRAPAWQQLPSNVTFTTRLPANAVFCTMAPPRTGRPGRPALKGARLGTCAQIATTAQWTPVTVYRYGEHVQVTVATLTCLWWGSLRDTPVRVVLLREAGSRRPYDLALVSTDLQADPTDLIGRYAERWAIEQAIKDAKDLLGAGQAQNRTRTAVERTVPFTLLGLTILTLWYHHAGHPEADLADRRAACRWYRHKRHIAVTDMLTAFHRARITAITTSHSPPQQNPSDPATWQPTAA